MIQYVIEVNIKGWVYIKNLIKALKGKDNINKREKQRINIVQITKPDTECIKYYGEDKIILIVKCPICEKVHRYELNFLPYTVFYKASNPIAYEPVVDYIVLYCPIKKVHYKMCLIKPYPLHFSELRKVKIIKEDTRNEEEQ